MFWSTFRAGDHLTDLVVTWLAYSVLACVLIQVVVRFRAETTASVFLAGALYGWLTEGTLVGTLYGTESSAPFPLSLVWTGLSWHALISVLVCWHFLGRALRDPRPWKTLAWSAALGVYWGCWAPFLWRETPPEVSSVPTFAAHAFAGSAFWILGYWILLRRPIASMRPGWPGLVFALLVLTVFFGAQVKALGLRPLVVLSPLVGLVLGLLEWRRRKEPADLDTKIDYRPVNVGSLLALLATPTLAVALYQTQLTLEVSGIPPIQFYRVCGVVSVAVLLWAICRVFREARGSRENAGVK